MPELVLGSATDHGVCWQLVSDWDLCAGWLAVSPLPSSGLTTAHAGACLEGRQSRSRLGAVGVGAGGVAGEGARKGSLGVLKW